MQIYLINTIVGAALVVALIVLMYFVITFSKAGIIPATKLKKQLSTLTKSFHALVKPFRIST
jgi:hypothetical protein